MKLMFTSALTLALGASSAESLSLNEKAYIALAIGGPIAAIECNLTVVEGGLGAFADRNDIDGDTLRAAVQAAIRAIARQSYETSDLIPAVTKLVIADAVKVRTDMEKDRAETCAKWTKVLREEGVIEDNQL